MEKKYQKNGLPTVIFCQAKVIKYSSRYAVDEPTNVVCPQLFTIVQCF
jgi:hypothetical protein